jgi:hypothetical protein
MAKLKNNPIGPSDLSEYLKNYSDFEFELAILKLLRSQGLECEHGGLYEDPVTKKAREFDIRALAQDGIFRVRLAVECKNIGENFPLLVSCTPRHKSEAFHQAAKVEQEEPQNYAAGFTAPHARVVKLWHENSRYKVGERVGKSLAQVGRTKDKHEIFSSDSDFFEKWSQCLSSASDLVSRSYWEDHDCDGPFLLTTMVPIVVVPDGRLWTVEYNADGFQVTEPTQSEQCSFFVGKAYEVEPLLGTSFTLSHMEVMTVAGLGRFVTENLRGTGFRTLLPRDEILSAVANEMNE